MCIALRIRCLNTLSPRPRNSPATGLGGAALSLRTRYRCRSSDSRCSIFTKTTPAPCKAPAPLGLVSVRVRSKSSAHRTLCPVAGSYWHQALCSASTHTAQAATCRRRRRHCRHRSVMWCGSVFHREITRWHAGVPRCPPPPPRGSPSTCARREGKIRLETPRVCSNDLILFAPRALQASSTSGVHASQQVT